MSTLSRLLTSGTTGTPSYIPLTAGDLDNWVTGSARSYAASGITAGQRWCGASSNTTTPSFDGTPIDVAIRTSARKGARERAQSRPPANGVFVFIFHKSITY